MLISEEEVVGLKLYSLNEGELNGKVKSLILDPITNKLIAFLIQGRETPKSESVIPFKNIVIIGRNALIIESSSLIKSVNEEGAEFKKPEKKSIGKTFFDSKTGDILKKGLIGERNEIFID